MLSKRSKKEFQEEFPELCKLMNNGMEYPSKYEDWFDSGEKSLTAKEIGTINIWFALNPKHELVKKYSKYLIDYLYIDFYELLSVEEGIKLIEKILSEDEKEKKE